MSMNSARTVAASIVANDWTDVWVYFTAPVLAMLLAGEIFIKSLVS
jgi:aquaporin Z